jgi:hypothetical protein
MSSKARIHDHSGDNHTTYPRLKTKDLVSIFTPPRKREVKGYAKPS